MPYTPTDWQDSPATTSPLDAANLTKLETGVQTAQSTAESALSVANGNNAYADAKAITGVQPAVSTNVTLVVNKHNPIDASAAARTGTLPTATGNAGARLTVEKIDSSTNAVTVSGPIRSTTTTTLTLSLAHEALELLSDGAGAWWPISGHKTLSSTDSRYGLGLISRTAKLTPFLAALAKRRTRPVNVCCIGASGTEGYPVTSWDATFPGELANALRAKFPTPGVVGGRGFIGVPQDAQEALWWPLAKSGTWTKDTTQGFSAKFLIWYSNTSGAKITLTVPAAGLTSFDLHVLGGTTSGVGYYKIDGGASVPVTVNSAPSGWHKIHVASPVTTSIEFGWTSGSAVYFGGITEYNGDENAGIHVHNLGFGGSGATKWTAHVAGYGWPQHLSTLLPDLIVCDLGANDRIQASSSATFNAAFVSFLSILRAGVVRTVTDGVLSGTTLTSATASFLDGDQGKIVSGPNYAPGTAIQSVTSLTQVTLTKAGVNGSGLSTTIGNVPPVLWNGIYTVDTATFTYPEPWANYIAKVRALEVTDSALVVVDQSVRMPTSAGDTTGLFYTDQIHSEPGGAAYQMEVDYIAALLAATN